MKKPTKPLYEQFGLNEAEYKRFKAACQRTCDYIASDLDTEDQAQLIEAVLDADRIYMYGERPKDKAEWKAFYSKISGIIQANYRKKAFMDMMKEIIH